ncbi:DNA-binding protein [Puniceicoccales bacterium CK1056]|uniref:DNA-(apurinic or apyrimidinic site) lyase n=1 Tax=Oceanipulchritudo coccoides TaxID=2706888 RepID=A0A6B2LZD7_9BACT|nr:DNA-binding protein [Oceanipulchritudo coccoides]NDV60855.1 DNA-binding protein [Oceanipulchritudo coccoides]
MEKFSLGNAVSLPAWETLCPEPFFTGETLKETLIGGQAFRWFWDCTNECWIGGWASHVVALRLNDQRLESARLTSQTTPDDILHYLGIDRVQPWIDQLPCNADPVLESLRQRWSSLSLLRQPAEETLLAFICSSNKQILQIRTMLHNLSIRFGTKIPGTPLSTLPDWKSLANVSEADLRACALGYRAAHIAGTAAFLRESPDFLRTINQLPLADASDALQRLPGVGPKVADCLLLFGYGFAEAFPVDTWIEKILKEKYPDLAKWNRVQLATFARIHFGKAGGLAQQWMFAEARTNK